MRSAALIVLLARWRWRWPRCGDAEELSKEDATTLTASRADLDDALDTEETLRTSNEEAASLRIKVQKIIGRGAFENGGKPDEFGLAALGELRELVPSLVLERGNAGAALDTAATKEFLAQAVSDPAAALYLPAKSEVDAIAEVVGGDDVGPDTKVRARTQTVTEYLRETERDITARVAAAGRPPEVRARGPLMRDPGHVAVGTWSGGRFMHFGAELDDERLARLLTPGDGIDTVLTADTYGAGDADRLLGSALSGVPREDYCLVGAVGHDFYEGERDGPRGFPRFTDPRLRGPDGYADYLRMATEASLERCGADAFDLLLLHNPDRTGYTSEAVWDAMAALRADGLAGAIGVAPGPGQRLHPRPDRLPGALRRPDRLGHGHPEPAGAVAGRVRAARRRARGRARDHPRGGLRRAVLGRPGGRLRVPQAATTAAFGPTGWVERGLERIEQMRPIAERHGLTPLQLACQWNLAHPAVACCAPTLIQEAGDHARPVEDKRAELAATPATVTLSEAEAGAPSARWATTAARWCSRAPPPTTRARRSPTAGRCRTSWLRVAERWGIDPARDLVKSPASASAAASAWPCGWCPTATASR